MNSQPRPASQECQSALAPCQFSRHVAENDIDRVKSTGSVIGDQIGGLLQTQPGGIQLSPGKAPD